MRCYVDDSNGNSWIDLLLFNRITLKLCYVSHLFSLPISLQTRDTIDPVLFWKSIFYGCWPLGLAFFSCELGQQFTNTFDRFTDDFDQLDWYLFPVKIQRILPIVINNVQKAVSFECFGIISGSRDQFRKVEFINLNERHTIWFWITEIFLLYFD